MRLQCPGRCSVCGSTYDATQWSGLRLLERLSSETVGLYVISWPRHAVIEARVCAHCDRRITHVTEYVRGRRSAGLRQIASVA
jgi:RNA polymerase subunit RPABC4/transcription elongation factor Spt4